MSELRRDPVTGRWVIIAQERANRPTDFPPERRRRPKHRRSCPFCPGNEHMTTPEILAYRDNATQPNTPGWWVRCVPNKYPALRAEEPMERRGFGMFDQMSGVGVHEVLIESPEHGLTLADQPVHQISEVLWAARDRIADLKRDVRLRYILVFKNHGSGAGATLDHPHCQIIGLPVVPKRVQEEIDGAKRHFDYKERCVFCDMIRQELADGQRVLVESKHFAAILPFASRFPFETWILPRDHAPHFHEMEHGWVKDLAQTVKTTLSRIKGALGDPAFNLLIHTTPLADERPPHYHWHIEIMPKITTVAGFEWATGFYINPVAPEEATKYLVGVDLGSD